MNRETAERLGIDLSLTESILTAYNSGKYSIYPPIHVTGIPQIDGETIIDREGEHFALPAEKAKKQVEKLGIPVSFEGVKVNKEGKFLLSYLFLEQVGILLYPLYSFGILNGGSATSYVDNKRNRSFNPFLFDLYKKDFDIFSARWGNKPKGITPAFIQPNGEEGPSFIELKMRSLLLETLRYRHLARRTDSGPFPLFQMTSFFNDSEITETYKFYKASPHLEPLIKFTNIDITETLTGVQPLIAAFTHSGEGRVKNIFMNAFGKPGEPLPLPGGHGQNFFVLRDVYRELYKNGKRFISLGNVDNLGYTPDPVSLALLALSGKQAGFDFSFKTPVDIKGGILISDRNNRLNCADIGSAVSREEVLEAEDQGKSILFNCATGLFCLEYLLDNLDRIIANLPVRFSDQEKDAGAYSQAEQITWEVIGLLDDFLIFAVDKFKRFLASKLLLENLMTSGLFLNRYPEKTAEERDLKSLSVNLHSGLTALLETTYGMEMRGGKWVPLGIKELTPRNFNASTGEIRK